MANIFLAFDENDDNIGSFNQGCKEDYQDFLEGKDHSVTYIDSKVLEPNNIEVTIKDNPPFIFAAYSHGGIDGLYVNGVGYISTGLNVTLFKNSFFYTVSCLTGTALGSELINNGCRCYFGYKTNFNSWAGYKAFSECANFGLFKFLDGIDSNTVYDLMIEKYNEHIDDLRENNSSIQASLLLENRRGLVKLGDNISIHHLV